MNNHNTQFNPQSGNVIIIIFIAVALFGALAFAFNQTSRTSTSFISSSAADAYANEILAYANEIKTTYKRMRLLGYDSTEIDFNNPVHLSWASSPGVTNPTNGNCTTNKCKMFHPEGGAMQAKLFEDMNIGVSGGGSNSSSRARFGHVQFATTNIVNSGTSDNDLTMHIPGLKPEICLAINKKAKPPIDSIPGESFGAWGDRRYHDPLETVPSALNAALLINQEFACYTSTYYTNSFFIVLERR